jgi:hypothetical protein
LPTELLTSIVETYLKLSLSSNGYPLKSQIFRE